MSARFRLDNVTGSLKIDDLDYYTGYTLKPSYPMSLMLAARLTLKDSRNFELQYKIAFRDIDLAEFYRKKRGSSSSVSRFHERYTYGPVKLLCQSQIE